MHCNNCDNGTEYKASSRNIRDSTVNGGGADKISVLIDMKPNAIKIGMVYSSPIIDAVFRSLKNTSKIPIVLDPISCCWYWRQTTPRRSIQIICITTDTIIHPDNPKQDGSEKLADMTINTDSDALKVRE